jgi:Tfp pilus assembly protein PilW
MSKIMLIAAGAAGYVLGTRAGRERYEQIATQAQKVWTNPKVAQKRQEAKEAAMAQAPAVKEKLQGAASSVTDRGSSSTSTTTLPPTTVPPVTPTTATVPPVTPTTATSPPVTPTPAAPTGTSTTGDQSMSQESTPAATNPVV